MNIDFFKETIIDYTYDNLFNYIMSDKRVVSILISKILGLDKKIISNNIKYLSDKLEISKVNGKQVYTDLIFRLYDTIIIIEMNRNPSKIMHIKNELYKEKVGASYLSRGEYYNKKPKVILINIDKDFVDINKVKDKYKEENIIEVYKYMYNGKELIYSTSTIVHVSLKNIVAKEKKVGYNLLNEFEKLFILILGVDKEKRKELSSESEELRIMYKKMSECENIEDFIGYYDKPRIMAQVERETRELEREEAIKKGMRKGRKEGIKEGRMEGIRESTINIINNMLSLNTDINYISTITGYSIEDINKIKK